MSTTPSVAGTPQRSNTESVPMDTEIYGVVTVICGCCGQTHISINRRAWNREPLFCERCMALPDATAEAMILARESERIASDLPIVEVIW